MVFLPRTNQQSVRVSFWAIAIGAACSLGLSSSAQAAQLGAGWTYSLDAPDDGSGGIGYEIKGIGMSVQNDRLLVAITGGMPLTGTAAATVADGNIGWGDLLFNFTGQPINSAQGSLFGIHFAATNDSPIAGSNPGGTGVYANASASSVTAINSGYSSFGQYYSHGYDRLNTMGSGLSTSAAVLSYFGASTLPQTSLQSGQKVGEVALLTASDLSAKGLNFGSATGTQTFGFSVDAALLPTGNFIATLLTECANDGVAIAASPPSAAVPEPATIAGTALGIAAIARLKRRQQR